MRFLTKMVLICVVLVALVTGSALRAPVVQATEVGLIRCINKTTAPLVFSVDGDEETCRTTPQGECNVTYAVGEHSLYAEYDDGTNRARKTIKLTSAGYVWTVR